VPDFVAVNRVLVEVEMDPACVCGPPLLSDSTTKWPKSDSFDTPITTTVRWQEVDIFVPTVAGMLEACCRREKRKCAPVECLGPRYYINLLICYLFLEREEQRRKLADKVRGESWEYLCKQLDDYVRTDKRTG